MVYGGSSPLSTQLGYGVESSNHKDTLGSDPSCFYVGHDKNEAKYK